MTEAIVTRIPNKPGTLAEVANVLGDSNVNITGLACTAHGDHGTLYVICDDPQKAQKAMKKINTEADVRPVFSKRLTNKPGALAEFTQQLARENVNIREAFGTAPQGTNDAEIWFDVEDPEKARRFFS